MSAQAEGQRWLTPKLATFSSRARFGRRGWLRAIAVAVVLVPACARGDQSHADIVIKGRVIDEYHGPVANAWIGVQEAVGGGIDQRLHEPPSIRVVRSNAEGQWSMDQLSPGTWVVTAATAESCYDEADFCRRILGPPGVASGAGLSKTLVHVGTSGDVTPGRVFLGLLTESERSPTIVGHLAGTLDSHRFGYVITIVRPHPVLLDTGSHDIALSSQQAPDECRSTVARSNGTFEISGFDADAPCYVEVMAVSLSPDDNVTGLVFRRVIEGSEMRDVPLVIPIRRHHRVTLSVAPSASTEGNVTFRLWDEDHMVRSISGPTEETALVMTDGTYLVRAETADEMSAVEPMRIDGRSDEVSRRLVLAPSALPSRVVLRQSNGKMIDSARVVVGIPEAMDFPHPYRLCFYGDNGEVTLDHLFAGDYEIQITLLDGGDPWRVDFTGRVHTTRGAAITVDVNSPAESSIQEWPPR